MSEDKNSQMSFFPDKPQEFRPETDIGYVYENPENQNTLDNGNADPSENAAEQTLSETEPENIPLSEILPEHTVTPQTVTTSESIPKIRDTKHKQKRKKLDFEPANSVIITFLVFIGSTVAKTFRNSFTATVFTAYNKIFSDVKETFLYKTLFSQKTDRISLKIKKVLRRIATNARIPSLIGDLFSSLLKIKARTYGLVCFSFGVVTLLLHFFVTCNFSVFNVDVFAPVTAAFLIFFSLFFIISGKPISDILKESYFLSILLFDFLGIKRPSHAESEVVEFPVSGACIIGFLLGACTLFFPAVSVILVAVTVIYTFVVIKYPETGIISLILITPLLSDFALTYICSVITVSYIFKILIGKRTPNFEFTEIAVALFLALTLASGIITFGAQAGFFSNALFIMAYFLIICTLRDKIWFERAVKSVVLSACVYASFSLFVTFFGKYLEIDFSYIPNTDTSALHSNVLQSSYVLGMILLCSVFYMLTAFFTAKTFTNKLAFLIFMVISAIFIFRETSVSMIFALIIATAVYLLLKSKRTAVFIIIVFIIAPLVLSFHTEALNIIKAEINGELYRLDIWNAVINMFGKYGISGIGIGTGAFSDIYSTFYIGNSVNVTHAHSLLFQIAFSLGFFGVLLFALIIFFIMQGALTYGRNCTDKSSENRLLCYSGMCSVIALCVCGLTEYIWLNPRIMLAFWLFCGLAVCSRRSSAGVSDENQFD